MPKLKLKNILTRVILGESWRERDNWDYLSAELELNASESHPLVRFGSTSDDDEEEDDRYSMNSFSTTATASNLPGAGRTIDTYIYQPMGRRIERLARHFPSLSSHDPNVAVSAAATTADTDDINDNANSINSFSTTATADNLPGTGRAVDTYFFQPMGKQIERLALRFTIASLHPARIAHFIELDYTYFNPNVIADATLNELITIVCNGSQNGSTIVAGMKGLVKQTQCVAQPFRGRKL